MQLARGARRYKEQLMTIAEWLEEKAERKGCKRACKKALSKVAYKGRDEVR